MENIKKNFAVYRAPSRPRGKRFSHGLAGVLLVVCFLACAACQSGQGNFGEPPPREVVDDFGRRVKIPLKIERAVSLAPNLTENIFAVGAGDRLVGVTTFCNYPEEARKIQKIGDTINPNMEAIIALKPQHRFYLDRFANRIFYQNARTAKHRRFRHRRRRIWKAFIAICISSAKFSAPDDEARRKVDEMKRRVADVEARAGNAPEVKVFVQISKEPLFTIGKDSFLTEIIERAGGVSVTADVPTAYPKFSKETALALQPEAIILSESEDNH